jgi:hypothetical protein
MNLYKPIFFETKSMTNPKRKLITLLGWALGGLLLCALIVSMTSSGSQKSEASTNLRALPVLNQMPDVAQIGNPTVESQVNQIKYRSDSIASLAKISKKSSLRKISKALAQRSRKMGKENELDQNLAKNLVTLVENYEGFRRRLVNNSEISRDQGLELSNEVLEDVQDLWGAAGEADAGFEGQFLDLVAAAAGGKKPSDREKVIEARAREKFAAWKNREAGKEERAKAAESQSQKKLDGEFNQW